jgi:hypothetical protein
LARPGGPTLVHGEERNLPPTSIDSKRRARESQALPETHPHDGIAMTRNRHHFRLELLAHAAWHRGEQCPDSDMLAAFALRLLRGRPRRRVAAHLRTCVVCRTDARLSRPPGTIPQRGALSALLRAGSRPSPERDSRTMRPSIDEHGACREFAAALASAHDPASLLRSSSTRPARCCARCTAW